MNENHDVISNRMLNTKAASALLNVSVNTLRRWGDAGKIDFWRISPRGDRRFKREDIERLAWGLFKNTDGGTSA